MNLLADTASTARLAPILVYLKEHFSGYPYDDSKDPAYFSRLLEDFCDLNILEELKSYHAWTLDQPAEKKIFYRSRFRSWLKTAVRFQQGAYYRPYQWRCRRA